MTRMATGRQLKAGRNALDWSIEHLAGRSGVSARTIIRYEECEGHPPTRGGNLERIVAALEAAGIEFIVTPDGAPGIVIRTPR